jgi:hypothetical protein
MQVEAPASARPAPSPTPPTPRATQPAASAMRAGAEACAHAHTQVALVLYHYFFAGESCPLAVYVAARICVAAYLFLTGFGRTASALQRPGAGAFLRLQVSCLRAPRLPRGFRSRPNPLRVRDLVRAQYLIFMTLRLNFLTCLVAWVAPAPCRLSCSAALRGSPQLCPQVTGRAWSYYYFTPIITCAPGPHRRRAAPGRQRIPYLQGSSGVLVFAAPATRETPRLERARRCHARRPRPPGR